MLLSSSKLFAYIANMVNATRLHPLKKWRISAGLTLEDAARQIGTSRQVWSDWERGRRRPAEALMIEIYTLTSGEVVPNHFYDLPSLSVKRAA